MSADARSDGCHVQLTASANDNNTRSHVDSRVSQMRKLIEKEQEDERCLGESMERMRWRNRSCVWRRREGGMGN